nr:uncharacterized protein LOC124816327 [Hydra vulgaris]
MSGIYYGVQARFREINHLAEWIPCAAHSLNLVGSATVECCSAAVNYFGLLENINIVNKALQEPGIELCTIIKLYDGLIQNIQFEGQAKDLTESDYKEATQRKRIRKQFDDEVMDTSNPSLNVSTRDNFRIQQFYVIIDRLNNEMEKRRAAYKVLYERFNFLLDNRFLSTEEVVAKTKALIQLYPSDLEDEFTDVFLLFSQMFNDGKSVSDKIKLQIDNKLVESFPNVIIDFRIYLSILRTITVLGRNSEGESFWIHLLKSSLALLSIENEVMREMTFEDVIVDFANTKSRKVKVI